MTSHCSCTQFNARVAGARRGRWITKWIDPAVYVHTSPSYTTGSVSSLGRGPILLFALEGEPSRDLPFLLEAWFLSAACSASTCIRHAARLFVSVWFCRCSSVCSFLWIAYIRPNSARVGGLDMNCCGPVRQSKPREFSRRGDLLSPCLSFCK